MLASLRLRAVTSIIFSCCALVTPVSAQDEDVFSEARARLEAGLSAMVGSPISIDRIEETPSKDLIEIAIAQGPVLECELNGVKRMYLRQRKSSLLRIDCPNLEICINTLSPLD